MPISSRRQLARISRTRPSLTMSRIMSGAGQARATMRSFPSNRDGIERAIDARLAGREPDLFAIRRPRQALNGEPFAGQAIFLCPCQIDHRQRSAVVALHRMIDECDLVSLWEKRADARSIRRFRTTAFQWDIPAGCVRPYRAPRKTGSVRRPVRPLHLLQHFARSSSDQRRARQRAHIHPGADGFAVQQDRHLRGAEDTDISWVRLRPMERDFGSFRTRGEHIHRTPLPGRAVENRLPIRSKPRRANAATTKRQLPVSRRRQRRRSEKQLAGIHARGQRKQQCRLQAPVAIGRALRLRASAVCAHRS